MRRCASATELAVLLVLASSLSGCFLEFDADPSSRACEEDEECFPGEACTQGVCAPSDAGDVGDDTSDATTGVSVSGTVVGSSRSVSVCFFDEEATIAAPQAGTDGEGAWTVADVTPGSYTVVACNDDGGVVLVVDVPEETGRLQTLTLESACSCGTQCPTFAALPCSPSP